MQVQDFRADGFAMCGMTDALADQLLSLPVTLLLPPSNFKKRHVQITTHLSQPHLSGYITLVQQ